MPHQHADARRNADYFGLGLGDDRRLYRAKVVAGALSILALAAMSITSLFRVPNPVWPVVLAVLAVGLGVAMTIRVVRAGS
ncbi:MAG: hypothetical protein ACT4NP_11105 [Pseudonocardiales bacterium]